MLPGKLLAPKFWTQYEGKQHLIVYTPKHCLRSPQAEIETNLPTSMKSQSKSEVPGFQHYKVCPLPGSHNYKNYISKMVIHPPAASVIFCLLRLECQRFTKDQFPALSGNMEAAQTLCIPGKDLPTSHHTAT